jgi:hypothetical protein
MGTRTSTSTRDARPRTISKGRTSEIAAELEAIAKEDSGLKEFIAKVPKHPLPKMDEYTRL